MSTELKNTDSQPGEGALCELNQSFHTEYKARKKRFRQCLEDEGYLILVRMDDRLVACCDGEEQAWQVNHDKYHQLKALAHVALTVFYQLKCYKKDETNLEALIQHLKKLPQYHVHQHHHSETISRLSLALIDSTRESGCLSYDQLSAYADDMQNIFGELIGDAAKDEVSSLLTVMEEVAERYTHASSKTFIVVMGGHQARYKQLSKSFFEKWFQGLDDRIVDVEHHVRYCEGGTSTADAMDLVATALTDEELGVAFLHTAVGLNQDVLGYAADNAIKDAVKSGHLR